MQPSQSPKPVAPIRSADTYSPVSYTHLDVYKRQVPARFIHRRVRVSLRASEVVVFDGRLQIARHARVITRGGQSVNLDHYLEVLKGKPGALPGSTALAQARESGAFTPAHEAFWANARRRLGDAVGTRELICLLYTSRCV